MFRAPRRTGETIVTGTESDDTAETYPVELRFRKGSTKRIDVPAEETVLEAAETAGIGLPFGCLTGACGTCTARLIEGDLDHRRPPRALKDRHRETGYVLSCIAVPRSACVLEVGAAVQADLVSNPWK
ncbi:ferredoxin [Halobacteriales archaeon QS_3_64_16]|nr:MAG: ferredoxin [Halobacteriales archaeon QS_3_64_16]